jgi:magnesium-transporting ATPase (P-type)
MIMEASKDSYPHEFGAFLRAKFGVIYEIVMLPGTISGGSSVVFQLINFLAKNYVKQYNNPIHYKANHTFSLDAMVFNSCIITLTISSCLVESISRSPIASISLYHCTKYTLA